MESMTVESADGVKLHARIFKPSSPRGDSNVAVVLVHPFTIMGGCQGLLRGIATRIADEGFIGVTFDLRGAGRSTGRPSLTGFPEIKDVVAVCSWAADALPVDSIVLVGSSAGAPIAGSAVDKIDKVVAYVSIGYPFGLMASILFGRHYQAILQSKKPKLFIMGTKDGFTSVKQLENKVKCAAGMVKTHLIEGAGHFEMEGPAFDAQMAELIANFIGSLQRQ